MRWLRRLLYFVAFLLWLGIMFFPCMAFSLAMNQQIEAGDPEGSYVRIFLLQSSENEGVGVLWKRPFPEQAHCYKTNVNYFMWAGAGENSTYCECLDPQTGASSPLDPQFCR